jgi:glutaredoxin
MGVSIPDVGYYMISKDNCVYCEMSEELFEQADQVYSKVYLDLCEFKHLVPENVKIFPFIFKDGKYFGGFKELNRELGF